ncbi:AAA family ATPase [Luteolibacter sp. GHJ8]|uniref:AAA family ATPase n=1 Tax=Luteolibacter rhizosphaerae TaxID=2989719 RepID=A0ABT3G3B2_9BACT|nr:AAA family ATPase [Luteolibacter rhizosphaerae]MCW1914147.1 AAA family ATPase [Luteolibacter rhizosphaerae]
MSFSFNIPYYPGQENAKPITVELLMRGAGKSEEEIAEYLAANAAADAEAEAEIARASQPYTPAPATKKRQWLQTWTTRDFINFQAPPDFKLMGECHLTRGSLTVLGGWPGVGKSRAALALAIAGARGVPWLGHRVHARFRTLIIQCENGPHRLKEELAEALQGQGTVLDDSLLITPPPPYGLAFQEAGFRQELREKIASFKPGLVIIDPWNRAADGDKQADYRTALDSIFECLPEDPAEKPALLVIHHMRKKSGEVSRKQGRDLLHELAGSYQIGSAARCVFVLEAASNDTCDNAVVLTCCKNNDGVEGAPSAWFRRNGLFEPNPEFDMAGFLEGAETISNKGTRVPFAEIRETLQGMRGESTGRAAARLVEADVCSRATAYRVLKQFPDHIIEDSEGKLWWKEG